MNEKVTLMILKVDLQCPCCYNKVKKILCKFPQIRDQIYDEKHNLVKITVVCCSPEKIRDKLCCKGRKVIHTIQIVEPPPSPPPTKPDKPPDKPKPQEQQPVIPVRPHRHCCVPCSEGHGGGPCNYGHYGASPPVPPPPPPCYDNYGYWYSYGKPPCYVSRCDYFSEENATACIIM